MTELRQVFQVPIKLLLRVVKVIRSTYYYARAHQQHERLADCRIDEIRQEDAKYTKKYGYRRLTEALQEHGFTVNHKRVLRIMREHDWLCLAYNRQKRKYNSYKGTIGKVSPNRLNRRFKTDRPYQKLVIDVSEFRYGGMSQNERIYLEPVIDLFSDEVLAF
ncbi:IS3 family transposase [Lactobacillus sp. CBA3606]|uniref:IS3 family transposase n=1 Tax=Lactobacillus sp. CBA3606 TaxID=2099789 RepID=UPI001319D821